MTKEEIEKMFPPRLSVNQIAEFMDMSISWVYEQKYQGKLKVLQPKKGCAVKIWRNDFIEFLEKEGYING